MAKVIVHMEFKSSMGFGENNPSIGFHFSILTDTDRSKSGFVTLTKPMMASLSSTGIMNQIRTKVKEAYLALESVTITDADIVIFGGPQ